MIKQFRPEFATYAILSPRTTNFEGQLGTKRELDNIQIKNQTALVASYQGHVELGDNLVSMLLPAEFC